MEVKCSAGEENKRSTWEKCRLGLWNMIINNMLLLWISSQIRSVQDVLLFLVCWHVLEQHIFFKSPCNSMTCLEKVYQRKTHPSPPPLTLVFSSRYLDPVFSTYALSSSVFLGLFPPVPSSLAPSVLPSLPNCSKIADDFSVPNLPCIVHGWLNCWTPRLFLFYSYVFTFFLQPSVPQLIIMSNKVLLKEIYNCSYIWILPNNSGKEISIFSLRLGSSFPLHLILPHVPWAYCHILSAPLKTLSLYL